MLTCLVTRAMHLELCEDYSAAETHLKIRNFLAVRVPALTQIEIHSDNSKTFKKVATMSFPLHKVKWKFIPERTPHWGGAWERLNSVTKRCLRTSLRNKRFKASELGVLLLDLSSAINARPITDMSTDIRDAPPLCPADFLYGVKPPPFQEPSSLPSVSLKRRELWRQREAEILWRRFRSEYLSRLRQWAVSPRGATHALFTPQVGDVVHIIEHTPRATWPLAIIDSLLPGRDGHVRAAWIRVGKRVVRRGIKSLAPIERME